MSSEISYQCETTNNQYKTPNTKCPFGKHHQVVHGLGLTCLESWPFQQPISIKVHEEGDATIYHHTWLLSLDDNLLWEKDGFSQTYVYSQASRSLRMPSHNFRMNSAALRLYREATARFANLTWKVAGIAEQPPEIVDSCTIMIGIISGTFCSWSYSKHVADVLILELSVPVIDP